MDCEGNDSTKDNPTKRFKKDNAAAAASELGSKATTSGNTSKATGESLSLDEDDKSVYDDSLRVFLMPFGVTNDYSIQISEKAAIKSQYIKEVIDGRKSSEYIYERDPNDPSKYLLNASNRKIVRAVINEVKQLYTGNRTEPEGKDDKPLFSFVDVQMPEPVTRTHIQWVADYLKHHVNDGDLPETTPLWSNNPKDCIKDEFDIDLTNKILLHKPEQASFYEFSTSIPSLGIHSLELLLSKRLACMLYGTLIHSHSLAHLVLVLQTLRHFVFLFF